MEDRKYKLVEFRQYPEEELIKRIKNILLCHFMVGTAHASLLVSIQDDPKTLHETIIMYIAILLSVRRYLMFCNDFIYIHSKTFNKWSVTLRYENIPYLGLSIVASDVIILIYRFLHYFIDTELVVRDKEMITLCSYFLIPGLIFFMIHTALEEKVVYPEILDPTYIVEERLVDEDQDTEC